MRYYTTTQTPATGRGTLTETSESKLDQELGATANASVLAHGRAISFEVKLGAVNSLPANRVH